MENQKINGNLFGAYRSNGIKVLQTNQFCGITINMFKNKSKNVNANITKLPTKR